VSSCTSKTLKPSCLARGSMAQIFADEGLTFEQLQNSSQPEFTLGGDYRKLVCDPSTGQTRRLQSDVSGHGYGDADGAGGGPGVERPALLGRAEAPGADRRRQALSEGQGKADTLPAGCRTRVLRD
jgi:hypothetical protein